MKEGSTMINKINGMLGTVLVLGFLPVSSSAHEVTHAVGQIIPIDCSTEVILGTIVEDGKMVSKYQRRTHYSIPLSVVAEHFEIPEDTGFSNFNLPVVAVGTGDVDFKDTASVPIKSSEGVLSVIDPFGFPWRVVDEAESIAKITTLECYIVY